MWNVRDVRTANKEIHNEGNFQQIYKKIHTKIDFSNKTYIVIQTKIMTPLLENRVYRAC